MRIRNGRVLYVMAAALAMACATLLSVKSSGQDDRPGSWQLLRAQYGWQDRQTDVTDLLRDLLARGGVNGRVAVDNQTMGGDPAVTRDKTLRIVARSRDGQEREFTFREGSSVDVAMFAVRRDDWDDHPRVEERRDDRPRVEGTTG